MTDPVDVGMKLAMPIMQRIGKFAPSEQELCEIGKMIDCLVGSAQVHAVENGLSPAKEEYRKLIGQKLASLDLMADVPPEPVVPAAPVKTDEKAWKRTVNGIVEWARENPGSAGNPERMKDGGPGDSDCITSFLASIFHAAGQRCRVVGVSAPDGHSAIFAEVFHSGFPPATKIMDMPPEVRGGFHPELPNFQWIPILPFHGWIHEGAEILTWKRMVEQEL